MLLTGRQVGPFLGTRPIAKCHMLGEKEVRSGMGNGGRPLLILKNIKDWKNFTS